MTNPRLQSPIYSPISRFIKLIIRNRPTGVGIDKGQIINRSGYRWKRQRSPAITTIGGFEQGRRSNAHPSHIAHIFVYKIYATQITGGTAV